MVSEVPAIRNNWWLYVVLGAICLLAGIVTIVWPDKTLLVLGIFVGISLMVAAVMEIVDAIFGDPGGRALSALLGVITLIAGLVCFRRPGESLLAIVIVLGIYLVAEGVFRIVRALASDGLRWWGVGLGALNAVIGIVILSWPELGLATLAVFFAISMLLRGIVAVVIGFKLRGLQDADTAPSEQTATFA